MFLAFLIGKEVSDITVSDLFTPFYVIIAAFIILGIISLMAPLPEVKAAGEDDSEGGAEACPYAASKTSVWQFPHLLLGCLALFLYVGVETVSLGTLVDYANSLHLENLSSLCLDCSDRYCDRIYLRYHLYTQIHQSGYSIKNMLNPRHCRFNSGSTHPD